MKVNKNSWHYKLLARTHVMSKFYADFNNIKYMLNRGMTLLEIYEEQYAWRDLPTNFCQYWRRAIIKPTFTIVINAIIASIVLTLIVLNPIEAAGVVAVIVGGFAVLAAAGGLAVGGATLYEHFTKKVSNADGLIGNAIKAHKEHICSEIDYDKN